MIIDMHCHFSGLGKDWDNPDTVYLDSRTQGVTEQQRFDYNTMYMFLQHHLTVVAGEAGLPPIEVTSDYVNLLHTLLLQSKKLNGLVLLGMDAVYHQGQASKERTTQWIRNDLLYDTVCDLSRRLEGTGRKVYFGASVNPHRPDWKEELEKVIDQGAALIKWIPSTMEIDIAQAPAEFYQIMREAGVPLLCHIGVENTFPEPEGSEKRNDFRLLETPLNAGVTVIAAHSNAVKGPHYSRRIDSFGDFLQAQNELGNRLYGDISALTSSGKLKYLRKVIRDIDQRYLIHGSDFPLPFKETIIPIFYRDLDYDEAVAIYECRNPLDRDILIKTSFDLDERILHRSAEVIRMT